MIRLSTATLTAEFKDALSRRTDASSALEVYVDILSFPFLPD